MGLMVSRHSTMVAAKILRQSVLILTMGSCENKRARVKIKQAMPLNRMLADRPSCEIMYDYEVFRQNLKHEPFRDPVCPSAVRPCV